MLLQHWKVGHSKLAWNVRQNPKVIEAFKKIWDSDDLITSFDGASIYILDKPTRESKSWFHVDQSYMRYELVKVNIVRADLRSDKRHVYPHRVMYFDADSYGMMAEDVYDGKKEIMH